MTRVQALEELQRLLIALDRDHGRRIDFRTVGGRAIKVEAMRLAAELGPHEHWWDLVVAAVGVNR